MQPNLLVIHTDQQSAWSLSAYGGIVETPNADRLAREGAIFTNFFTNSAVCTPSRGCFLTGRYPHCHGAWRNNIPLNRDEVTFAEVLRRAGYETGYAGKWHLDGTPRPGWVHPDRAMGFADARYMFNRGHWKRIDDPPMADMQPIVGPYEAIGDETTYTTDWLTDKAVEFLRRPRERSFCYMVSYPDPHPPLTVRPPYNSMFRPEDMSVPETFWQEDVPSWAEAPRSRSPYGPDAPDGEQRLRHDKAVYCGEVKLIDDCVGRLLETLADLGMLDRTVVVFTTDHGEYMGEHGLHAKNQIYETAYHIPMLVRFPAAVRGGTVIERVVSTVDFPPTILRLMGQEPCGREQGRDASPLLRGRTTAWRDEAFLHHSSLDRAGIFTADFELCLVRGEEHVLFDRRSDPQQVHNLFGDERYADVVADLTGRVVTHNERIGSPAASWLRGA